MRIDSHMAEICSGTHACAKALSILLTLSILKWPAPSFNILILESEEVYFAKLFVSNKTIMCLSYSEDFKTRIESLSGVRRSIYCLLHRFKSVAVHLETLISRVSHTMRGHLKYSGCIKVCSLSFQLQNLAGVRESQYYYLRRKIYVSLETNSYQALPETGGSK